MLPFTLIPWTLQIAWMSIGIQMTASALSLATMIPVNWSVVITVFICSIYTTMVVNSNLDCSYS